MAGVALIQFINGKSFVDIFTLAVALSVAAIPAGLPVAITVALSVASSRMAERNVRFWHSHTHGYLTASADERKSPPRPYLRKAHNEDQHDEGNHTTKSLWSFEFAKTATSGGALQWAPQNAGQSVGAGAKEKVRVRHVATGRYLAVVPKDRRSAQTLREIESGAQEPDAGAEFDMTLEDEPTPRGEFFLHPIIELTSDKRIKKDDCSVRLEHVFEHAVSVSDADGRREVKTCWFHQPKGKLKPKKVADPNAPPKVPSTKLELPGGRVRGKLTGSYTFQDEAFRRAGMADATSRPASTR